MSSNNYNAYNYPYQQSSAQQSSAYQTAPASNNAAQPSRQYQQPSTTQAQDYMSYQPQSYAGQSSGYGTGQDNSWNSSSYGGTRETTSRAAEVLRNMSNPSYTSNSTSAINSAGPIATNTSASHPNRYSHGNSHSPQVQAQQPTSAYGQSQPRPRSVNTNRTQTATSRGLSSPAMTAGYPSQRAQSMYNQQQQRSASPAQHQYHATPASSARSAGTPANANQQYADYNGRQLPSVDASRSSQNATSSTSYNYGNATQISSTANAPPAHTDSMSETYSAHSTTTVDPTAVYDPWSEYQRKQAVQKAMEDAARAEKEIEAEEARKVEEQKKEEERKRQEEADRLKQPKPKAKKVQKQQPNTAELVAAATNEDTGPGEALESEIRAMMVKMRELNSKDPALLARIWEEERRAKAPKSPTTQNKDTAQTIAAQPVQVSTPQVANSRKKTVPKAANATASKPATQAITQAVPVKQMQATISRPGGNTVWPPEKKAHLANAAAAYLNGQNLAQQVDSARILSMLDTNPSYIELCEQLEQMGLKLDRAVFAKSLLTAVPDVNSASRKSVPQLAPVPVQRAHVPPAVMKKDLGTPVAASPQYTPAAASPGNSSSYPPFPGNGSPAATPVPVAEMVPIKPELRKPANKEEAARKRNLSDLVDLTQLEDEEDMGPPPKRLNADSMYAFGSPHPHVQDAMVVDEEPSTPNFPIASVHTHPPQAVVSQPIQPPNELRYASYVEPLDRKKALRRNNYNPATIARDVLLACGRHPSERYLNQHLDVLKTTLPQITNDADLSTIKWDLIDPGYPPAGYFKDGVQALTEDADDEEDSDAEEREPRPRAPSSAIGGEGGAQARVQALPEAINPFKQKRRGRPPRHSFPDGANPATPKRPHKSSTMTSSAPRPTTAAGVGYQAFRSVTEYGPDGQPLPKKKGRPVGWRKAIHGSAAAQARPALNGQTGPVNKHQPTQPSSLRNVRTGGNEPIRIDSRSPSAPNRLPQYQSYKCKWQNCTAELHNLETLKKHIFKVHRKETPNNILECLWDECGKEVTNFDPLTNMRIERHQPYSFDLESTWRGHIQQTHVDPLSWELGDGPASGLSDAHDSEAYLSDAQGRQVTPRITVDPERIQAITASPQALISGPRGRGRPPKNTAEQEARDAHNRLVSQKKRIGGPGMDRGGVTLVNDKRRRGFNDNDGTEEELVDAND